MPSTPSVGAETTSEGCSLISSYTVDTVLLKCIDSDKFYLESCYWIIMLWLCSSAFRHTTGFHSPVTVPLFSKLQPAVRLYCGITVNCPHRTVTKLAFTAFSPRALLSRIPGVGRWLTRGFRSQRKEDRFEVIQGFAKDREHSLLRPLLFTAIVSC